MSKNALFLSFFVVFMLLSAPLAAYADSNPSFVDTSSLADGIIRLDYPLQTGQAGIVRISKGNVKYDYPFEQGANYPLQMGNGDYTVIVGAAIGGNKYKVVAQQTVSLNMQNEYAVFLQSIPIIDWTPTTKAVLKAKRLTANLKSDKDKVAAIYTYITKNYKYDLKKAQTVEGNYVPNLDKIYASYRGICYDYAALFAAMARSQGIPTKLVMGYEAHNPAIYHAWNQVYLKDLKKWVTIDTTYDSALIQSGQAAAMYKNESSYKSTKFY
ncbi:transglutaminase-like domain-containing protein [Paenibacillus humicola]|uniref:transglutaminase-like domain-containing protein n=1 Tax=Paenibacillus humicola TaxID=3110540 RepID=UPI00237B643C|nr:transglutaminase-like domain-containing protein [Paenibacillus humicola]